MDEDEIIERAVRQVARNLCVFLVGALLCGLVGLLMGSCRTVRYVSVPAAPYIAQNLAICRDTMCPAVLTENLFQDNKEDVDFLLSEVGKEKVTTTHVNAIVEFIKDYYG